MEHTDHIIAWELLFIFVFSSLLIIQSTNPGLLSITGRATQSIPSQNDVLSEIDSSIQNLDFINDANDFSMCLIVNVDPITVYSFDVVKTNGAVAVTSSDQLLCKGTQNEDIIISYVSYDALKLQLSSNPAFDTFKNTGDGTAFYVYPSKLILPGMKIADPVTLKAKFGTILNKYFTQQEINQMLNPAQPQTSSPLPATSYLFYIIIGLVSLVLVVSIGIVLFSKKPDIKENLEIVSYIKSSVAQGFTREQVRQALLSSGWPEEKIQEAFKSMNSGP